MKIPILESKKAGSGGEDETEHKEHGDEEEAAEKRVFVLEVEEEEEEKGGGEEDSEEGLGRGMAGLLLIGRVVFVEGGVESRGAEKRGWSACQRGLLRRH